MEGLISHGFLALPTVFISLSLAGALIALVWRRLGLALALASSLCLYAAATPALSAWLLRRLETAVPGTPDLRAAQAIVVLGGDVEVGGGDIQDRLGPLSLERVVLGAQAYRRLHLPVAVSGGMVDRAQQSVAALMKTALETDFGVPVKWSEERSRTTWENAVDTARLLRPQGIATVVVVTQGWHLPRASWSFARAGLTPLPWPAPRRAPHALRPGDLLPGLAALSDTAFAVHEIIGGLYYRLRY